MPLPILDPKAADIAEEALEEVGAFTQGHATPQDKAQAVEYVLAHWAQDPYMPTVPAECLLEAITHIIGQV